MSTLDLFEDAPDITEADFDTVLANTLAAINAVLATAPVCVSWSAGKDSSVVLSLTLEAAGRRRQRGEHLHPIVVMTADTRVESPEVHAYARAELRAVQRFARQHGLDVRTEVTTPRLTESWALTILSGRSLPSFIGGHSDCTSQMKVQPLQRAQKRFDKELPGLVNLLGTRFDESARRAANMRKRQETAEQIWTGADGRRYLSPIAYWSTDSVWTYIGTVMADETLRTYSSFEELHRIYRDASGSTCVVVAEMAGQVKSKPCGARTGCWSCLKVERDESLEAMLASDPRYAYMKGLAALRNYLLATRYDWSKRTWMPWAPEVDGSIEIKPHRYRPSFLAELLHLCLSLDAKEQQAAAQLGIEPRFQIVDLRTLIAIDAHWALHVFASGGNVIFQDSQGP